jgi:hypothetical protein
MSGVTSPKPDCGGPLGRRSKQFLKQPAGNLFIKTKREGKKMEEHRKRT